MEAPVWAAWIAAGASLLALLGNIALQLWQGRKSAAHQLKLQEQQLKFQQAALAHSADTAYMDWLRGKRLDAMVRLQDAFEEVMDVHDLWGSSESRGENREAWDSRAKAASNQMASAVYRVRLVFGLHLDLLTNCSELAELADKMCRLVLLPWEIGQKLENWGQMLEDHKRWRKKLDGKYAVIWAKMHLLTTPLPKGEWEMVQRYLEESTEVAEDITR